MSENAFPWHRLAVIGVLAEKMPAGRLDHTALVSCAFFLQVLRGVPLGYHFSLYAYGPHDMRVLGDLDYAKMLDAVRVKTVLSPKSYHYEIRRGPAAEEVKERATEFLGAHQHDIDWVIREFGSLSAADLELAGTMVYADREAHRVNEKLSLRELTRRVLLVKPRFSEEQALAHARALQSKGLLKSVQVGDAH